MALAVSGSMATAAALASAAATVYTAYSSDQARKDQKNAMNDAKQRQATMDAQADQAYNKANPKGTDSSAMIAQIQQAAKGGPSGTMLTGPSGIDPSVLNLGKTTLLGG